MSLIVDQVSHSFGTDLALDQVSLEIAQGEVVCLFGPSGCGKTTLLRLIAGFEPLSSGQIVLNEQMLSNPSESIAPDLRPIGFVFQDFALFPHMTVEKNVAFGLKGLGGKERRDRVAAELASVNLGPHAQKYPHELSGGQQQRVALARAFVRRPSAMLLDEPFASLDVTMRRKLRTSMRVMLKEHQVTSLIVTHDPQEALALGDRIAILGEGRLIEIATPSSLFHDPRTLEGALLINGSQKIQGTVVGNQFKSGFGSFSLAGKDRSEISGHAAIVVREGALSLTEEANGYARVADCRFAGPGWVVTIEPSDETDFYQALDVSAEKPFDAGTRLSLDVSSIAGVFLDPESER